MTHTSETPCRIASFSRQRRAMSAMLSIAATKHMVHALIEIDVTRSRRILHEQGLSFTAFIATCIGQAVGENPSVQSMRLGRKRLVIYDDVDISILVEHDAASGKLPTPYVARKSNRKSVQEIHDGIRTAQQQTAEQSFGPARWMPYLPRFVLRFIFWLIGRQPRLMRQFGGTVALTAVGMFGTGLGWGMPISLATLMVTLGGIGQRLSYVDGKLVPRDVLCLTASFDHDLVDGAPAARFTDRLKELVESGYGLD